VAALPKLPEPARTFVLGDKEITYYTADQMLAFQRETVEACAKAVEAMVHGNVHTCAAEIRSMNHG
jgi:hypothetical protein